LIRQSFGPLALYSKDDKALENYLVKLAMPGVKEVIIASMAKVQKNWIKTQDQQRDSENRVQIVAGLRAEIAAPVREDLRPDRGIDVMRRLKSVGKGAMYVLAIIAPLFVVSRFSGNVTRGVAV
jgi:hypothetical protein